MQFSFEASSHSYKLNAPFVIARGAKTHAEVIEVRVGFEGHFGVGEAVPYARYGETVADCLAELRAVDYSRPRNINSLKYRASQNALNCAIWDLRAKIAGAPAWHLIGAEQPQPVRTAQTLSIADAKTVEKAAKQLPPTALVKMKLGGADDLASIRAVRAVLPEASLIVDANEGWTVDDYRKLIPELEKAGVEMIEQPFPSDQDYLLKDLERPIPICADESAHDAENIAKLKPYYDMVNIKLDKTGGLSRALKMRTAALAHEMPYMIGCMVGSSLSMAPAQLLAHGAKYVDLDGPLFLEQDIENAIVYEDGIMYPATKALWG